MHSYTLEGVVIKRNNSGEADKIITLFTRTHGKVALLAKGVRKISSRRSGHIEVFNIVKASAAVGRGGLDLLTEIETLQSHSQWKKQLGRVTLAYELCETVDRLTADNQPHPELYDSLTSFLTRISDLDSHWRIQMDVWLVEIVRDLGYWPAAQPFTGDIHAFIEEISQTHIRSRRLLAKLTKHS